MAAPKYHTRTASEFDFSAAPVFRKTAMVRKSEVRRAEAEEAVSTMINGAEETRNTARPGDYIVTGGQGERWVITAAKFGDLYEEDRSDPSRYISKNRVRALKVNENTEMKAPWGETQRVLKGGYVVQRVDKLDDIYLIEKQSFKDSYKKEK